jgi:hypothetical protein
MKKIRILILLKIVCLAAIPTMAQKLVPYTFRFEQKADSLKEPEIKVLTQVTYSQAVSLRLYFKGTQLGENSYLLLESTDGAKQELRKQDLENWRYSSAYFNGNTVKVSLKAAAGEKNRVHISDIKVGEKQAAQPSTARISSETLQAPQAASSSASLTETYPYAAAVGRFTNGTKSFGTGWIAPNGAIVTSYYIYITYVSDDHFSADYDIIEFNIPPSDAATIKHPGPEDQYPLVKQTNDHNNVGPAFKNASRNSSYIGGWAILQALPNSTTGLRPGERQGQFFRIASANPGIFVTSSDVFHVDIFHYGKPLTVSGSGPLPALQLETTTLLPQDGYLKSNSGVVYYNREWFILYNAPGLQDFISNDVIGGDAGGPITYQNSNFAIGVHNRNTQDFTAYGTGFSNGDFRNDLNDFFSSKSVYVDYEPRSQNNTGNGEIYSPYRAVSQAVMAAPDGAQIYIAKGNYSSTFTINRPMTLRAPVGKVIIGSSAANARTVAGPSIPSELFMDNKPISFNDLAEEELASSASLVSSPNPFTDRTEVKYLLPEETAVSVKVYDIIGNEIRTLLQASQLKGNHSVVWDGQDSWGNPASTGKYIIKLQAGTQIRSVRVIKK